MTEAPYPPAETPADGDLTNVVPPTPRFSASASVPVPPPNSPPGPASFSSAQGPGGATYGGMPGSPFSQGNPYGQPPPPPPPPPAAALPPPPAASGQARVAASASVPPPAPSTYGAPPAPTTYSLAAQGYPAQPGVYGQPGGAQFDAPGGLFGQPPGPGAAPAPAGQGGFGAPPSYAPAPPPQPGAGGYGAGVYGQSAQREPQMQPQMQPPGEWTGSEPAERKPRRGLIIALIAAAVVVVVAVGGYVGFRMMQGGSTYAIGTCVLQQGTGAAVVDCTKTGAFRITSIVDGENTCPDANQPSLVLTDVGGGKKYACLVPASSS